MKFLVTGGAGFIGSNIVERLLKMGYSVSILDNFSTGRRENLNDFAKDIEIIEGDIRNYHLVLKSVKNIDVILHQAALPSVQRSIIDPIKTNEVNICGTLNILEAAKKQGVRRIVFASSSSVYGDSEELPKHEKMIPNPLSPYAISKLTCEHYLKVFNKLYGLETISLRYFNVFGPKQDPNSQYSAVIPKFIKAIKNRERPTIYGDGSQSRDFTYIENVVQANILASTANLKDFGISLNIACNFNVTLNELINYIVKYLNVDIKPIYLKSRVGDIKHSLAEIKLAKKMIKYSPNVSFEKGIKLTIDSFF